MANETTEELAELAEDIFDEGINVYISKGDTVKMFAAIIAANIATVFILNGLKVIIKSKLKTPSDEETETKKKIKK